MAQRPTITVLGPNPLLTVAVEQRAGGDEIHVHAGGQGVWVARMAAELGAHPILCGFVGGALGATLTSALGAIGGECRTVETRGASGSYVVDRRGSERRLLAASWAPAPSRHEVDDLVSAACAAALHSELLVLCNPYPLEGFPEDAYDVIAAAAHAGGVPLLVDLSTPRLDRVLAARPALVKLNDWELAQYVVGPVDGPRALGAAQRLIDAGAGAVAMTRAGEPILVVPAGGEPFEIVPPRFEHGHREGCGDTMMGAVAAGWARGLPLRDALVLGAAAGSGNFLRRGLGTGRRRTVEELAVAVTVRPLASSRARAR